MASTEFYKPIQWLYTKHTNISQRVKRNSNELPNRKKTSEFQSIVWFYLRETEREKRKEKKRINRSRRQKRERTHAHIFRSFFEIFLLFFVVFWFIEKIVHELACAEFALSLTHKRIPIKSSINSIIIIYIIYVGCDR